jgi:hypothetical protein
MDNAEKLATYCIQDEEKTKKKPTQLFVYFCKKLTVLVLVLKT